MAGKGGDRARWGEARHSFRVLAAEIVAELDMSASKKQVYEKYLFSPSLWWNQSN